MSRNTKSLKFLRQNMKDENMPVIHLRFKAFKKPTLGLLLTSALIFQMPWRSLRTNSDLILAAVISHGIPD